ncbi:MAG TPA: MFS transporter [Devosia sp.]|nr:MFS transporter [Devosia sp.]
MIDGPRALLLALRNPNFSIYTVGNAVSLIGTWMHRLAAGWLTWELTHSGTWLGLIAFADLFPTVVITPFAGAAADRWDRVKVVQATLLLSFLPSLLLFVLVVTDTITIELLLLSTLLLGAAAAFNVPARLALIPSLVPRTELNAAVAVNSVVFNLARFVGPWLAALLIATAGVDYAFLANALSFVVFWAAMLRVDVASQKQAVAASAGMWREIAEGARYVVQHRGIAAILVLLAATALGGRPLVELLPGFASDVFQTDASGLAAMTAAIGIGAMVGGLTLGVDSEPAPLMRRLIFATVCLALASMVFTSTRALWFALPLLVIAGFGHARIGIAAQTLIQLTTEESKRGRMLAIYGMLFRGGPAVGALIIGFASDYIGLPWALFAGGVLMFSVWIWAFALRHRITRSFVSSPPDETSA